MQNEVQYDLDKKAAKISALCFKNLKKYEYLTEDLGLKPNTVEQAKFDYSPLGNVLTNNNKSKTNKNKVIIKTNRAKICSVIIYSIIL